MGTLDVIVDTILADSVLIPAYRYDDTKEMLKIGQFGFPFKPFT